MEQQTSEWLKWRERGLGGSDIASVLGLSPYKTAYRLLQEKRGVVKPDDKPNFAMERGNRFEPVARSHVELLSGKAWPPALVVHPVHEYLRVSLDGQCGDEILEIKVPSEKLLREVQTKGLGGVPDYYIVQMQLQLMCTGAKRCLFFIFHPEKTETASCWVEPSPQWFARIEKAAAEFWGWVTEGNGEPALEDKDYIELDDRRFLDAAKEYRDITKTIKILEEKLEIAKAHIIEQAKVHPAIRGGGIKCSGFMVKGNVDYAKVPALQGVDLEPYRKPARKQYKVTVEK